MSNQATYNVAIIGKTGVGKSSIINYLYGRNIVETGVGAPVTKKGFHAVPTSINGLPTTIYDSMGLEADKYQDWISSLEIEIKKRGADKPPSDWFHSVFYCINAGGSRIEPVDSEVIQKLISEKYKVSVILTKCDQISESDEAILKQSIKNKFNSVSIIPTCVGAKNRNGESPAFGKEEIQQKAFEDFFDSLISRLPIRCEVVMRIIKEEWRKDVDDFIDDINFAGFNAKEQREKIAARTAHVGETIISSAKKELYETLTMFSDFAKKLGYPPIDAYSSNANRIHLSDKEESDLSWFEIPLVIVASPAVIIWGVFFGKSDAKKDISDDISAISSRIDETIAKIKNDITDQLRKAKIDACKPRDK